MLKLKTREFQLLTRSHTPPLPPSSQHVLTDTALSLRSRVELPARTRYRLVGVGLANFHDPHDPRVQPTLFDAAEFA